MRLLQRLRQAVAAADRLVDLADHVAQGRLFSQLQQGVERLAERQTGVQQGRQLQGEHLDVVLIQAAATQLPAGSQAHAFAAAELADADRDLAVAFQVARDGCGVGRFQLAFGDIAVVTRGLVAEQRHGLRPIRCWPG